MRVLKFGADWCGPCKALDKRLEGFTECPIIRYDVNDIHEELADKYNIKTIPVTVLEDDEGNQIRRWTGLFNIQELKDEISKH